MAVWVTSALYSAPKFFWVKTVTNEIEGFTETICIADRGRHNSEILDMISFALLYVMPLSVMTVSVTVLTINLSCCSENFATILILSLQYCILNLRVQQFLLFSYFIVGLRCVCGRVPDSLRNS